MGRLTVIVGGAAELDQARLELARSDRGYSTRFVPVDGLAERFAGWFRTDVLPDNLSIAVKEALEAIAPPLISRLGSHQRPAGLQTKRRRLAAPYVAHTLQPHSQRVSAPAHRCEGTY